MLVSKHSYCHAFRSSGRSWSCSSAWSFAGTRYDLSAKPSLLLYQPHRVQRVRLVDKEKWYYIAYYVVWCNIIWWLMIVRSPMYCIKHVCLCYLYIVVLCIIVLLYYALLYYVLWFILLYIIVLCIIVLCIIVLYIIILCIIVLCIIVVLYYCFILMYSLYWYTIPFDIMCGDVFVCKLCYDVYVFVSYICLCGYYKQIFSQNQGVFWKIFLSR